MVELKEKENVAVQLYDKIQQTADFLKNKFQIQPRVALVLGTGMSGLTSLLDEKVEIAYTDIPHFPEVTVDSHKGDLVFGKINGVEIIAFAGRFHYYEGYTYDEVTFGVRVSKALGAEYLFTTNAAGGLNPGFDLGDIMLVSDHINLMGENPLRGDNDERFGPRFPDMCEPYSQQLIKKCQAIALEEKIKLQKGVLVGVTGPCLETRAEYRFMQTIGADAVTMSTVPEVIVGVHAGMKCLSLSVLTDLCLPDALKPVNIEEIIKIANEAGPFVGKILFKVIEGLE